MVNVYESSSSVLQSRHTFEENNWEHSVRVVMYVVTHVVEI